MSVGRFLALAAALGLAGPAAFAGSSPPRPHVVLVVLDAVRADHLGCYGYARPTTPNLDRLARRGVVFEDAVSQSHMSLMGFASLFASRYPEAIGEFVAEKERPLPESTAMLARIFQENGYRTAGFAAGGYLAPHFGFARGFEHYEDLSGRTKSLADTMGAALRWMARHRDAPFFVFVHGNDAHAPVLPPAPYRHKFATGRQKALDALLATGSRFVGAFNDLQWREPAEGDAYESAVQSVRRDPRAVEHVRDHYDGAVLFQDKWIGRLVDRLSSWGLTGRTLVVVTADHGEELGERGWMGHRGRLYQSLVHIPLVIVDPRRDGRGVRVAGPVEQIDIAPTLLDLAGVAKPASFQGESLVSRMDGKAGTPSVDRCVHGSTIVSPEGRWRKSVRCGDWKLIYTKGPAGDGYELYDLRHDPAETSNLADARPDVTLRLSGRLLAHLSALSTAPPDGAVDKALPPELRRELEEAGYFDAGEKAAPGSGKELSGEGVRPAREGVPAECR